MRHMRVKAEGNIQLACSSNRTCISGCKQWEAREGRRHFKGRGIPESIEISSEIFWYNVLRNSNTKTTLPLFISKHNLYTVHRSNIYIYIIFIYKYIITYEQKPCDLIECELVECRNCISRLSSLMVMRQCV